MSAKTTRSDPGSFGGGNSLMIGAGLRVGDCVTPAHAVIADMNDAARNPLVTESRNALGLETGA
ncbi:MAG: hypothetical protein OXB95_11830 [Rhodobacteraceae bacterium]|nr:hypothetical protein [Paracoccaceae bacterium]